jgi:DNA mismatch repair protein MutL
MIEREGERLVAVTDIAFPRGTSVEVRDLFFNLPARRKFLRSASSEFGPVAKYVTQAALGAPGVRFTLVHGGRETITCPPVATLRERVFQLFGKKMIDGLMDVAADDGGARLEGLASLPLGGRPDKSVQYFFVNGRPVKDRVLMAALSQAYTGILERGRSPEAFLFLRLPYDEIDVNVHPAKAEVRFRDTQRIFRLVLRAVAEGAARGQVIKEVVPAGAAGTPRVAEGEAGYQAPGLEFPMPHRARRGERRGQGTCRYVSRFPGRRRAAASLLRWPRRPRQFANMFIIAADEASFIDQHNAHERVLFDKFREIDRLSAWPRKALLIPPILELSPSAAAALEANALLFEELGFRVEAMGGRSYALKEYPDLFKPAEAGDVFLSMLEEAGEKPAEERRDHMLATMACKSAVKAGEPLVREKMGYLVEELFKTSQPALCPHGRPIVVRIEKPTIDKAIGRHRGDQT